MATIGELQAAENSMRRLLRNQNLPEPDDVEYRHASIVLLWHDETVAVIVDVEEGPDHG